jgi:cell pole-organizing protein PopZ
MSDVTLAASVSALNALAHQPQPIHGSAVFRSGATVEDLVVEALKPLLKEWLDGHLPDLVRSLVEREIRRLSGN